MDYTGECQSIVSYYFWGGRIPLFMLIGWHTAKVTFFARGRSTFGQIGSMDCLLERSYCLQTHAPATVDGMKILRRF